MSYLDVSYFEEIKNISLQYLTRNYDYCYLKAMHEKNRLEGADTIIVGSSHSMNGIIEKELTNAGDVIQFSISSQDLFYDYENLKMAIKEAKRSIQRCLINLGYYMLYQDLSKSPMLQGIISTTYMNLFGDDKVHNFEGAKRVDLFQDISFDREKYPEEAIKEICSYWSNKVMHEQSSYYGSLLPRQNANLLGVKKVIWHLMSQEDKDNYAQNRTINGHNKLIKHADSRRENEEILRNMVKLLYENGIKIYFFITPYTRAYMNYIDPEYKPDIFKTLDGLELPVEFLDMNDYLEEFDDSDFLDSDHLNDIGASKATTLLNNFIGMVEENA